MCFHKESVETEIKGYLNTINDPTADVQIAFFGGSFTGIDREDMIYLLKVAKKFIDSGKVSSIRLSTRPDYINKEILDILSQYGVKTIELGIQSMNNNVLYACKRGHTTKDTEDACHLIKSYGFELIGQMMTALPASTPEDEIYTAEKICELGADGARIYPTMVFHDTHLADMTKTGEYIPPEEDRLIERTEGAFAVFVKNNVPVIRIGLQSNEGLQNKSELYAGAYNDAIGEMVISRYYLKLIQKQLIDMGAPFKEPTNITVYAPPGHTSKVVGHKGHNKMSIQNEYNVKYLKVLEKKDIMVYNVRIGY